jgi:hypothetical protein
MIGGDEGGSEGSERPDHFEGSDEMVPDLRVIVGALRNTIHAHGPITEQWISSAAKRILSGLAAARRVLGDGQ